MATFLTTTGISHELEELIKSADNKLWLVSPYLQIADIFRQRIKERSSQNIDIRIVYRKDTELSADEINFLLELNNVKVLTCENLHAKCYLNENIAIITSMNLYEYSQVKNREMGIKIYKKTEAELYDKVFKEVVSIMKASQQFSIKKMEKEFPVISTNGHCIRCGNDIPVNTEKPLCFDCYNSWLEYNNPLYEENFCHICGCGYATTYAKPICPNCYWKIH